MKEEHLFIGSSGDIKPRKKINWHKALIWSAIILISLTMAVIWFVALNRF